MLPACPPYPDELASSALLRCARHFNIALKSLVRATAQSSRRPRFLMTAPIGRLAELFQVQPERLLWEHTAFPYASAFLPSAGFDEALRDALNADHVTPLLSAVMHNASSGVEFRRYCPECVSAELEQRGESHWHVSHHLPAVWCCLKHGIYLHETKVEARNFTKTHNILPHETSGRPLARAKVSPVRMRLAQLSTALQTRSIGAGPIRDGSYYRQLAFDHAWLPAGGTISDRAVHTLMKARHSTALLRSAGLDPSTMAWSTLMMRPKVDTAQTTVKHVLLAELLTNPATGDWHAFTHRPSGPPPTSPDKLDDFYSERARGQLDSIRRRGEVLTTEAFLRRSSCLGTYRHRKAQLPKLRSVVLEFRSSGHSVKPLKPGSILFRSLPGELT